MINRNIVTSSDSYKYSHFLQYPPETTFVSAYIEARGYNINVFEKEPEIVFFGIDNFVRDYMLKPVTMQDIQFAQKLALAHGEPFDIDGWTRIVKVHKGYLPVGIQSLEDGTIAKCGIPLVQVYSTDIQIPWLPTFIETAIQRAIWYPTTVATLSREIKKIILHFLELTGDPSLIDFKLHDFGARGATSQESAMIGGLAHLVNFKGTDTFEALHYGFEHYGEVLGYSIPASEHSTITSWGRENEVKAFENMLDRFPTGLVACVSDSYDIYAATNELWPSLKDKIMSRDGTLVVRPDSGEPVVVVPIVLDMLGKHFGYTVNDKGYKVLDPHVRVIWGDGIDRRHLASILYSITSEGWSADNIAFGMGGALLQKIDRDTLKFAMKASYAVVGGMPIDVYKDPITAPGKVSKKGFLTTTRNTNTGELSYVSGYNIGDGEKVLFKYKYTSQAGTTNVNLDTDFSKIRERAAILTI